MVVSAAFVLTTVMSKSMGNIEERLFMVIHNDCSKFKKICNQTSEAILIVQNDRVNFANDVWRNLKPMQPNLLMNTSSTHSFVNQSGFDQIPEKMLEKMLNNMIFFIVKMDFHFDPDANY